MSFGASCVAWVVAAVTAAGLFLVQEPAATVPSPAGAPPANAAPPPRALALLVGIDRYAAPPGGEPLGELHGAANDVALARQVLIDRFGFDAGAIVTLVGEQATHEAIVTAFHRHLVQQAGPDTRVVFWFSGHGSRIPDAERRDAAPREIDEDPFDDTLVAYDSRAVDSAGSFDLADDELHALLRALRSQDVLVVTDCCHSGGVLRGRRDAGVRECGSGTAPWDWTRLQPFWPLPERPGDDAGEGELPSVVQIAACGALEEAGEFAAPGGTYGTMTWFLAQVLREVDARTPWDQVVATVRARVAGNGTRPTQTVRIAGNGARTLLGGLGRPVPAGFQVDGFGPHGLAIAAGAVHGIGENATLALVDAEGRELAVVKVDRVRTADCFATWPGPERRPTVAMRAVVKSAGDEAAPLRVHCGPGVDPAMLAGLPIARPCASAAEADVVLGRADEQIVLQDGSGRVSFDLGVDRADVEVGLWREYRFRSLWQGVAQTGSMPLRIAFEPASADDVTRYEIPAAAVRPMAEGAGTSAAALVGAPVLGTTGSRSGGLLRIRVENLGGEAVHVAILSVTESREINVIYGKDENNVLAPGGTVTRSILVGPDPAWPEDRPLIDRYVAIATDRFADFKPFEVPAPLARERGQADDMPAFLRASLEGTRTRGAPAARAWGIATGDLQIVSPVAFACLQAQDALAALAWDQALQILRAVTPASDRQRAQVAALLAQVEAAQAAAARSTAPAKGGDGR